MKIILSALVMMSCTTSATKEQYLRCEEYCQVEKACVSEVNEWLICDCLNGDRLRIERQVGAPERPPATEDSSYYLPFFRLNPLEGE